MAKKIISVILLILIIISLTGCSDKEPIRYQSEFIMLFDTVTRIVGYSKSKEEFTEYAQIIYDNLKEYHQLYDIYNDYEGINNIKTINDNAGIKPVKVDKRIIDLIKFSKDMYEKTNGKTNIAFGAVLRIWHEYRTIGIEDPANAALPPEEELRIASEHTNIEDIIIDEEQSTVFLRDPFMSLDVGAVAKGYATEQVSKIAKESGMNSALLSVGGNVRAINKNVTSNEPWNVGIQNPDTEAEESVIKIVKLDDSSLVTSGDYERFYIVDGEKYNHIINPDTLYPAKYFTAISIICKDSGLADALSTAVFCMPFEEGLEFINSLPEAEAMWIFSDKTIKYSDNFESFIKK
ncbi:MAG TPA: FAD:protein FMN transferase [Sedimentibacter sp.]|nr:FAD:protein FMN transferase [Sedimentibacter sp.]NLA12720.1 FAD:protein FMN transferase [Tissierellia bacterium]HAS91445.1 FAD:protein FMN transferase [Clostridiales bacterium]HOA19837.1 FAD:protein FMN transferase [Sedimentibacter sp.]HOG63448.1 FAD:protein FMN transferase [Sedimentibacter sp.]